MQNRTSSADLALALLKMNYLTTNGDGRLSI
jgi:hypothetical protein